MTNEEKFRLMACEELKSLVDSCQSIDQLWKRLGVAGKSVTVWRGICNEKGVSLKELYIRGGELRRLAGRTAGSALPYIQENFDKIFCVNSMFSNHQIRRSIHRFNEQTLWISENCYQCGLGRVWNGKYLRLQVDHKNGQDRDHRIENLGFICPNCHSQTDTYAAKNVGKKGDEFYLSRDGNLETAERLRGTRRFRT